MSRGVFAALMLALLGVASAALAQDDAPPDGGEPAVVAGVSQGEVAVSAIEFGTGNFVRPGSWMGLRLRVLDQGVRQRELLVRVAVRDPDGDTALYERGLASNPGQRQELWTYVRLPFDFRKSGDLQVRVFEAIDADTERPRAGRVVGEVLLQPVNVVPAESGLIGVVGPRVAGLGAYTEQSQEVYDTRLHQRTALVSRLDPAAMPDEWLGLEQFGTIVWTQGEPIALGAERTDALRRWVQRGGHLVVVLPAVGGTWLTGELNNPLADVMPAVTAERIADYPTAPLRPLLTHREGIALPRTMAAHVFDVEDAARASTVLAGAGGAPLVVRRAVGIGAVTLVGLDVASEALARVGAPSAQTFWHRVLGRRGDLTPWASRPRGTVQPPRVVVHYDESIDFSIAQTGSPASGVLLGFVVFIVYWFVAGPIGFALLKQVKRSRLAWVGFVATTAVFTGIAWGGAVLLSPATIRGSHLTILDHVYGQPVQRSRTWAGMIIPRYGEATVSVGGPRGSASEPVAASVSPWMSPTPSTTGGSFPDNRGYPVRPIARLDEPISMRFPVRSTMKEVQVDWAGGIAWAMPTPVAIDGGPGELRATPRPDGLPLEQAASEAVGFLEHDLPGDLEDVVIIVNPGMLPVRPGVSANVPISRNATAFSRPDPWPAGERLDLSAETLLTGRDRARATLSRYVDDQANRSVRFGSGGGLNTSAGEISKQLAIASLLSQAGPPSGTGGGVTASSLTASTVRAMHGFDLGRWMTQPCIIVLGHVGARSGDAPTPTPIEVDGREANLSGRTFVRWVYPLPPGPPAIEAETPPAAPPAPRPGG
ncbi:MAG: hypothetical protein AAFX79_06605 [Planctomycetota bacterium]